ncbi:MAG: phosphonopyruvate decarboxylase [Rhodospirillales bacterium]|nr:phosphonopyruvate decarboxylase [Rhodospirillales bacterium]MBO6788814.1 phosphonopyruvate decarboxylase [Rhodospirillales bacterium]
MIDAGTFLSKAKLKGFDFFTGVPCSFLTPLINGVLNDHDARYVAAASEGEAVAIAAGAWLCGRETVVMFQNSGLGNAVNPLTSLNYPFRIPSLVICTWRGGPGLSDEPQHELMGEITPDLFEVMRIPHSLFPTEEDRVLPMLDDAVAQMAESQLPSAFIMQKGDVADQDLGDVESPVAVLDGTIEDLRTNGAFPSRYDSLTAMLGVVPDDAGIIVTTGKSGRELFTIADREQHLYQVGSMGCAAGMGLGVALNTKKPIVVVDGDGALMMKMGTLATIGAYAPRNLVHLVLDNGTYDSTGGQPTVSGGVDFAACAVASGYKRGVRVDDIAGLDKALSSALTGDGPTLIHMKIAPGSLSKLGRPTVKPSDVARRFKAFLAKD